MLVSHLILLPNSMHHPNHGDKSEKRVDFSSHLNLSYYEKTAQNGSTLHILCRLLRLQVRFAQSSQLILPHQINILWLIFNLFPQLFGFPKSWCNGYDLPSLLHIIHIVLLASFSHSVYKLFTGYKTRIWISIHWLTWSWNFKALSIFVWFMCQFVCRLVWNVVEIMCNYQEKMIPILDYSNCTMGCF